MKTFKNLFHFSALLTLASCTQLLSHRDYLTEMEHEDESYFRPQNDFPIVAGDTGRTWETSAERRERTPTSPEDLEAERSQQYLKQELRHLENKQSEASQEQYEKIKNRLSTTSEKIYFLKLNHYEKRDYLASRGLLEPERAPASLHEDMFGVRETNVILGMSKADVMSSLGRPSRVEVAGNPSFENERWLYNVNGASKYIYFESGRVGGWE